jgi:hypothetical protein
MEAESRDYPGEGGIAFSVRADRHDDDHGSDNSDGKKYTTQGLKKYFHIISISIMVY